MAVLRGERFRLSASPFWAHHFRFHSFSAQFVHGFEQYSCLRWCFAMKYGFGQSGLPHFFRRRGGVAWSSNTRSRYSVFVRYESSPNVRVKLSPFSAAKELAHPSMLARLPGFQIDWSHCR